MKDKLAELHGLQEEMGQILTMISMQMRLSDQLVTASMPKLVQLRQRIQQINSELDIQT